MGNEVCDRCGRSRPDSESLKRWGMGMRVPRGVSAEFADFLASFVEGGIKPPLPTLDSDTAEVSGYWVCPLCQTPGEVAAVEQENARLEERNPELRGRD